MIFLFKDENKTALFKLKLLLYQSEEVRERLNLLKKGKPDRYFQNYKNNIEHFVTFKQTRTVQKSHTIAINRAETSK